MKKQGFTIVELLAAIVIFAAVSAIATVAYTAVIERGKMNSFKTYEKTMYAEAMELMVDALLDPSKASYYPKNGETKRLSLTDIGIEPFNNPRNKNDICSTSYVDVKRNDYNNTSTKTYVDTLYYKVCLICTESDYNVTGNSCMYIPDTPWP